MQAVDGHAMSMGAQELIAPRRAVAADDINLEIRIPEFGREVVQQVEHPRIIFMNLAGAVVAQIMVQLRQRFWIIAGAVTVNDIQTLASVSVKKMQAVRTVRDILKLQLGCGSRDMPGGNQHQEKQVVRNL